MSKAKQVSKGLKAPFPVSNALNHFKAKPRTKLLLNKQETDLLGTFTVVRLVWKIFHAFIYI